jgi:hypothetical protein
VQCCAALAGSAVLCHAVPALQVTVTAAVPRALRPHLLLTSEVSSAPLPAPPLPASTAPPASSSPGGARPIFWAQNLRAGATGQGKISRMHEHRHRQGLLWLWLWLLLLLLLLLSGMLLRAWHVYM